MNLTRDDFEQCNIEEYGMGGGVIPMSVNPAGERVFLLGRERWVPVWKGSCRWSGFEGSRKEGESMLRTAIREFFEESMGVVGTDETDWIARLQSRAYWLRIVLRVQHMRRESFERYHTTYVVPIPWDNDIPARFHDLRCRVEQVDRLVQQWRYRRPSVLGPPCTEVGSIFKDESGALVVQRRLSKMPPGIVPPLWTVDSADPTRVRAVLEDPKTVRDVLEWHDLRMCIERALVVHPCITVSRDDHWQFLQEVTIQRDFLEKDQVRWWTQADLESVLAQRGHRGADRFRPYFLPVLQTLLCESRAHPPPQAGEEDVLPRVQWPPGLGQPTALGALRPCPVPELG